VTQVAYEGRAVSEPRNGRKRSLLAQERSRDTRQAIIRAALELWRDRGYAGGDDDPTAEEIAERAGVSKATFYLHFGRKDDILLETAWVTTKVFYEDAMQALLGGGPVDNALDDVTVRLCRRVQNVPRLILQRMLRAQVTAPELGTRRDDAGHFGFDRGFALICLHAQQSGELPQTIPAADLGRMFEAMVYESMREWAYDEDADLLAVLRTRFAVLLAGARTVTREALGR
jgi:AcrR family transcriptional regulator